MYFGIHKDDAVEFYLNSVLSDYGDFSHELFSLANDIELFGTTSVSPYHVPSQSLAEYGLAQRFTSSPWRTDIKITKVGREFLDFANNGYCWDFRNRHPSVAYTLGKYYFTLENLPGKNQKYDARFRTFLEHYSARREEVDAYISQAILSR